MLNRKIAFPRCECQNNGHLCVMPPCVYSPHMHSLCRLRRPGSHFRWVHLRRDRRKVVWSSCGNAENDQQRWNNCTSSTRWFDFSFTLYSIHAVLISMVLLGIIYFMSVLMWTLSQTRIISLNNDGHFCDIQYHVSGCGHSGRSSSSKSHPDVPDTNKYIDMCI